MKALAKVLWIVLAAAWAVTSPHPTAGAAERDRDRRAFCGKSHHISIQDLDMSPDPLSRGERVQRWRIKVRVDGSGECETTFEIRERPGNDVVARGGRRALRPGVNEIVLDGAEGYRLRRKEHCFEVLADIERTRRAVDAAERFCAHETANGKRWSMRERGDAPIRR
jgi:hypothetical protein